MLNRILLFLFVLTAINICLYGLGISAGYTVVDVISTETSESYITDNPNYTSIAPKSAESYKAYDNIYNLIISMAVGYSAIFTLLGLPTLIIFLLTAIISVIQVFCVFYLTAYFIGIFRGASI